jgi:hypothetical protein
MIKEKLFNIQQEFKSGKDMYNDFAKFSYRNLENMMTDLKPILKKYNCIITFNDDVVNVGNSNYIKTIVTLIDLETDETISVSGVAKEDENRAGMCSGQMSGCSSSYCRKYALCGLLAVNEEKDLDALDNRTKHNNPENPPVNNNNNNIPTKSNIELLKEFCSTKKLETGIDIDKLTKFYNYYTTKDFKGKMNPESLWERWIKPKAN